MNKRKLVLHILIFIVLLSWIYVSKIDHDRFYNNGEATSIIESKLAEQTSLSNIKVKYIDSKIFNYQYRLKKSMVQTFTFVLEADELHGYHYVGMVNNDFNLEHALAGLKRFMQNIAVTSEVQQQINEQMEDNVYLFINEAVDPQSDKKYITCYVAVSEEFTQYDSINEILESTKLYSESTIFNVEYVNIDMNYICDNVDLLFFFHDGPNPHFDFMNEYQRNKLYSKKAMYSLR